MTKRFIVLINNSVEEKDKELLSYINEHKLGWWHWLNNSWLLIDYNNTLSTEKIRDQLTQIYGELVYSLVIEMKQQGTWHGFGPATKERNMFEWLNEYWEKV